MSHTNESYIRLHKLAKEKGVFRLADAKAEGIHPEQVRRLFHQGVLERVSRGTYRLANSTVTEHQTMAEVCARVPRGTVCLLSALQFHELTTQAPFDVWLAIDPNIKKPTVKSLPIRFVRFSGEALTSGVEVHQTKSGEVRVYSIAKTIADCFKYRNKIGIDVPLEALRDAKAANKLDMDELWGFAKICRISKAIQPYLEAIS